MMPLRKDEDDESSALLRDEQQDETTVRSYGSATNNNVSEVGAEEANLSTKKQVFEFNAERKKALVLLFGAFLVNLDSACLFSVFREVASDFDNLHSAQWVINSYIIGIIVSQPLFGKLSDLYGRKKLLVTAYLCSVVGGIIAGCGPLFSIVLLGRCIAGFGSAGVSALTTILIVDLVPRRDVAPWRSYVYGVNQIGRAVGLPVGGFITDGLSWRWAILCQVPFQMFGVAFLCLKVTFPETEETDDASPETPLSKFKRIDFGGAVTLGLANCSALLFLENAPKEVDIVRNVYAMVPLATWIAFLAMFLVVEGILAREPIFPLRMLIRRNVYSSYAIQFMQTAAQMAIFTSVPLYFRITNGDSNSVLAMRLLDISAGTMAGVLISGYVIKRTGVYRNIIFVAQMFCIGALVAIFTRWRGSTGWLETQYGFPVGVGFGTALSAAYIGLTTGLEPSKLALATSGFYLSLNLGSLFGVGIASLLIHSHVQKALLKHLKGVPNRKEIARELTSSFDNIDRLTGPLKAILVRAYTQSLVKVWLFALICGCLGFMATFVMREGEPIDLKSKVPQQTGNSMTGRVRRLRNLLHA